MKTIKQSYKIKSPIEKVWQALVNPKLIEEWSGSPAKMDGEVGTNFELWGGDVHGTNIEATENKKLVQDWFGGDWPEASRVTFTLTKENDGTRLDLLNENIPDEEAESIADGWNRYYLGEIKKYLERPT